MRVLAYFAIASVVIAVPTGIKIFSWIATMWDGWIQFKAPICGRLVLFSCSRSGASPVWRSPIRGRPDITGYLLRS